MMNRFQTLLSNSTCAATAWVLAIVPLSDSYTGTDSDTDTGTGTGTNTGSGDQSVVRREARRSTLGRGARLSTMVRRCRLTP
jgi:hypothetical protein